jgi:hypothetical protein
MMALIIGLLAAALGAVPSSASSLSSDPTEITTTTTTSLALPPRPATSVSDQQIAVSALLGRVLGEDLAVAFTVTVVNTSNATAGWNEYATDSTGKIALSGSSGVEVRSLATLFHDASRSPCTLFTSAYRIQYHWHHGGVVLWAASMLWTLPAPHPSTNPPAGVGTHWSTQHALHGP